MGSMKYIIAILKGVKIMKIMKLPKLYFLEKMKRNKDTVEEKEESTSIFFYIVRNEFIDYIRTWRIIILLIIIVLTSFGPLYTAITTIDNSRSALKETQETAKDSYLF